MIVSPFLTPAEAAAAFGVNPKTLLKWANAGMLPHSRTLGGHRRYLRADVDKLIHPQPEPIVSVE